MEEFWKIFGKFLEKMKLLGFDITTLLCYELLVITLLISVLLAVMANVVQNEKHPENRVCIL